MPLDIPLPTASPEDDPEQYIPLLLSAIEGFLLARDVWEEADYNDAYQYMQQLMSWIVVLIGDDVMANPVGKTDIWWTDAAPDGWLLCDGASVLRADYSRLFDVIGTTFGAVDGTHFNLPNLNSRSPYGIGGASDIEIGQEYGQGAVSLSISQLPAHDHDFAQSAHSHTINDPGHIHTIEHTNSVVGGSVVRHASNTTGQTNPNGLTLSATTGISLNSANAGITFHSQGSNGSHFNIHPVLGCNFIIYAGE